MNIGELNFMNRSKVQKEVILPHSPTYVIDGGQNSGEVWYFTSEKWITLRKKKQNTSFGKFINSSFDHHDKNQQSKQQQPNNSSKDKNIKPPQLSQIPSLLFIIKESKSYLLSKVRHMIKDHSHDSNIQSQCSMCKQIEQNDYDFLLIERETFVHQMASLKQKDKQTKLDMLLDNVLEKNIITLKQHNNTTNPITIGLANNIQKSTFNQYIPHFLSHQGFKYTISRLQSLKEKYSFLKTNQNRINYRKYINNNNYNHQQSEVNQRQQQQQQATTQLDSSEQLYKKISSVLWSREYLIFDLEKDQTSSSHHHNKVINSHMKQKLQEKCEAIRQYLELHFRNIFISEYKQLYTIDPLNIMEIKVQVKQFRLWYLNNNMRNNHCYNICCSDVRVQFLLVEDNSKRWMGKFWTRVNIGASQVANKKCIKNQNKKRDIYKVVSNMKYKPRGEKINSTKLNFWKKPINKSMIKHQQYKNTQKQQQQPKEQSSNNDTDQCQCCSSSITQSLRFQPYINFLPLPNQQPQPKRLVISRHLNNLRSRVKQVLTHKIQLINDQLILQVGRDNKNVMKQRTSQQVQRENSLIQSGSMLSSILERLDKILLAEQKKKITSKKTKESSFVEYDEVVICQSCYQVFLRTINEKRKNNTQSRFQLSTLSVQRHNNNKSRPQSSKQTKHLQTLASTNHSDRLKVSLKQHHQYQFLTTKNKRIQSFIIDQTKPSLSIGTIIAQSKMHPSMNQSIPRPLSNHHQVSNNNNPYIRLLAKQQQKTQGDSQWSKTELEDAEQYRQVDINRRDHKKKQIWLQKDNISLAQQVQNNNVRPKTCKEKSQNHTKIDYFVQQSLPKYQNFTQLQLNDDQNHIEKPKPKRTRLQRFEEKLNL